MAQQNASTQQFVEIGAIRNGYILLKNGTYRMILSVNSINFDLKSEEEKNVLIFQYQSFLNSLHFPIQILIKSHKLDLAPYLAKLRGLGEEQTNALMKNQILDYADFVDRLVNMANIMKKNFYVVIPYTPISTESKGFLAGLFGKKDTASVTKISDQEFDANTEKLKERANIVASGLAGIGLRCQQLNTEQVIELLYQTYNLEVSYKERLTDASEVTSEFVAGSKEKQIFENTPQTAESTTVIDNLSLIKKKQGETEDPTVQEQKNFAMTDQNQQQQPKEN